jgi:hypothetical protein
MGACVYRENKLNTIKKPFMNQVLLLKICFYRNTGGKNGFLSILDATGYARQ